MIKEWLLARLLKNKTVFFERDNGYRLITDICFDDCTDVIICKNTKWESDDRMTENKKYSMKKRGGALFYFKDGVVMSDEDVLFDLNMLNDTKNALKFSRHRFEEATSKIEDLILDAIMEMHDGKRDYAEKLLNKAIELIRND